MKSQLFEIIYANGSNEIVSFCSISEVYEHLDACYAIHTRIPGSAISVTQITFRS